MNRQDAEKIFDRQWARMRRRLRDERRRLACRIYKTLAAGGSIVESFGTFQSDPWRAYDSRGGFYIAERMTPEHLTRHLTARLGFGTELEFVA